ncbi:MAG: hypothetical protein AAF502_01210 [Bacteroidota bacterium]
MKTIIFPLIIGLVTFASSFTPANQSFSSAEACNCEAEAIEEVNLFKSGDFSGLIKMNSKSTIELVDARIHLANYFKKSDYSSEAMKATAAKSAKRLKALKKKILRIQQNSKGSLVTQKIYLEFSFDLNEIYGLVVDEDEVMGYRKKKKPGDNTPISPIIPPNFNPIDCSGKGPGKSKAECEGEANDMLFACRDAAQMKSDCGYYDQFGDRGQDMANNEAAACRDKAFIFATICNLGGLGCGDEFSGSLQSFGQGTRNNILDEAMEACATLDRDPSNNTPAQTQTSEGN